MKRVTLTLLVFCYLLSSFGKVYAQVQFDDKRIPLDLSSYMQYTVSNSPILSGDEIWQNDISAIPRTPQQYVHFKVTIKNAFAENTPLWFSIIFPAIKQLTVKDGKHTWVTGDAMPFGTRPIKTPDYNFPVMLNALDTLHLSGHMRGEILRHNFIIGTPELISTSYRSTLLRDMSFFGAMSILVLISLVIFFATKHQAYLSFAAFALAIEAWVYRIYGYGFEMLWPNRPEFNDLSYALVLYAVMITSSWVILAALKQPDREVTAKKWYVLFLASLPVTGALGYFFVSLDLALRIPLMWFIPNLIFSSIILAIEHKKGSDRAKWFSFSIIPLLIGGIVVILFAQGIDIGIDPSVAIMQGIVATCALLTLLTSSRLIKVLQKDRDREKARSAQKTKEAETLEQLVKERTIELEENNKKLSLMASTDSLTQLPNRRSLDLFVDDIHHHSHTAIAMLDLDHFKRINDSYGHEVGDKVLVELAQLLLPLNRDSCIAGRFGGEEFAIIQRNVSADDFAVKMESLHQQVSKLSLAEYPDLNIRACIGWVICKNPEQVGESFRMADKALYKAKKNGRNQIIKAQFYSA